MVLICVVVVVVNLFMLVMILLLISGLMILLSCIIRFVLSRWLLMFKKKRGGGYLRFLKSIRFCGVVHMYSNPFSMSCVASVLLFAVLHVHSSSLVFRSCV